MLGIRSEISVPVGVVSPKAQCYGNSNFYCSQVARLNPEFELFSIDKVTNSELRGLFDEKIDFAQVVRKTLPEDDFEYVKRDGVALGDLEVICPVFYKQNDSNPHSLIQDYEREYQAHLSRADHQLFLATRQVGEDILAKIATQRNFDFVYCSIKRTSMVYGYGNDRGTNLLLRTCKLPLEGEFFQLKPSHN